MKFFTVLLVSVFSLFACVSDSYAEDYKEDRIVLKTILADIETAINKKDLTSALKHIHPEGFIIFHNGTVAKGHEGISAFNDKMFKGNAAILKGHSTKATVDAPATFYDHDMAVAYGTVVDNFKFMDGLDMDVESKWSATIRKNEGKWQVVAMSFTANVFDNPILSNAKKSVMYFALGGFLLGLIICIFVGKRCCEKRTK